MQLLSTTMGNRASRIKETRRQLKTMLEQQQAGGGGGGGGSLRDLRTGALGLSRGSSVCASTRQSMLDVSMRSSDDEHSGQRLYYI